MPKPTRIGGSFAPPLSDEKITAYEALAASADAPVQDAMKTMLTCVKQWWDLPYSTEDGASPHPSGVGRIIPLDDPIAKALWDAIPWKHELDAIQGLFDAIHAEQKDLRTAAFHLLWFVRELDLDREPITADLVRVQ